MITLKKLRPRENPDAPTATDTSKQAEEIPNNQSPWTGYTIRGEPLGAPEIGRRFFVQRKERNGEEVEGYFRTSPVTDVEDVSDNEKVLTTRNSVYLYRHDE